MDAEQQARMRTALGRNADRYLREFERIEAKGGWAPGWNWAAFLHSTGWFCYRYMNGWAVLNLLAPIVLAVALVMISGGRANDMHFLILTGAYLLVVFVLLPVFADSFYYRWLKARLADPQAVPRPPSVGTELGAVALGVLWFLVVLVGVLLPASGGYTPRAKVSEAILGASGMRRDIAEFHAQNERLPNLQEAARFRLEGPSGVSRYVESVIYEPQTQRIVVTLRGVQPGKKLALRVEERGGNLHWTCGPIDLDKKYLPGSCR